MYPYRVTQTEEPLAPESDGLNRLCSAPTQARANRAASGPAGKAGAMRATHYYYWGVPDGDDGDPAVPTGFEPKAGVRQINHERLKTELARLGAEGEQECGRQGKWAADRAERPPA